MLAHALIQRLNGTESIVLGQISPQRAVIYTNVKVYAFVFEIVFLKMIPAYLDTLVCSFVFIMEVS